MQQAANNSLTMQILKISHPSPSIRYRLSTISMDRGISDYPRQRLKFLNCGARETEKEILPSQSVRGDPRRMVSIKRDDQRGSKERRRSNLT